MRPAAPARHAGIPAPIGRVGRGELKVCPLDGGLASRRGRPRSKIFAVKDRLAIKFRGYYLAREHFDLANARPRSLPGLILLAPRLESRRSINLQPDDARELVRVRTCGEQAEVLGGTRSRIRKKLPQKIWAASQHQTACLHHARNLLFRASCAGTRERAGQHPARLDAKAPICSVEIWPQRSIHHGLLVLAAIPFLMNAIAGASGAVISPQTSGRFSIFQRRPKGPPRAHGPRAAPWSVNKVFRGRTASSLWA